MSDSATSDLFSYLKEKSNRSSKLRSQDASDAAADAPSDDADDALSDATSPPGDSSASLDFEDPTVGEQLRDASEETLNSTNFGIIRLNDDGVVQFFNAYESDLSGVAPEDAVGQNYFNELAPCSNNRVFYGRFRDGLKDGEMDEYFTYTFTYKMRPTLVDVHLYRDDEGNNWIMVRKR